MARNHYKSFAVGKYKEPISILQYADDTIFFGEATMENVRVIKSILRGFELASDLKINFAKSRFGAILIALPIYFFSFFRVPNIVADKLVKIQRNFLWGGGLEQRRIAWVRWDTVCLPKERGGLGVKDLRKFNIALLGKWRWELFHQNGQLWTRILNSKYRGWRNLDEERNNSLHSHCWKDLRQLNQIEE